MSRLLARVLLVIALLVGGTWACLGQVEEKKWEAFGGIGYSSFGSDDGSFGNGFEWNSGVGRHLFGPLRVQGQFRGAPFSREIPGGCLSSDPMTCHTHRTEGRVRYLTADAVFEPLWTRARPFVAMGYGLFDMDARFYEFVPGDRQFYSRHRNERKDWAVNLAAGLRIFARRDFSIRPEFRFSGSPGYLQARVAVLAGYHF